VLRIFLLIELLLQHSISLVFQIINQQPVSIPVKRQQANENDGGNFSQSNYKIVLNYDNRGCLSAAVVNSLPSAS
jgi:hypothetical protein